MNVSAHPEIWLCSDETEVVALTDFLWKSLRRGVRTRKSYRKLMSIKDMNIMPRQHAPARRWDALFGARTFSASQQKIAIFDGGRQEPLLRPAAHPNS